MNAQAASCWSRQVAPWGELSAGRKYTAMRHTEGLSSSLHARSCVTIIPDHVWSHPWIKRHCPSYSFRRIKECSGSSNARSVCNKYAQTQAHFCIQDPRHKTNREWLLAYQNSHFSRNIDNLYYNHPRKKKLFRDLFNLFYFKWMINDCRQI